MGGILTRTCDWCTGHADHLNEEEHQPFVIKHGASYGALPPIDYAAREALLQSLKNQDLIDFEKGALLTFNEEFELGPILGEGAFSAVHECTIKNGGMKKYAVKVTLRDSLNKDTLYCTLMGPYLLRKIYHPHIMRFRAFYKDDLNYYMVCEELEGGPLLDVLTHRRKNSGSMESADSSTTDASSNDSEDGYYTEAGVCRMMRSLLEGLEYIHARSIVHRDLKLDNLMLDQTGDLEFSTLKIVDFGFAEVVRPDVKITKMLGTPGYMAPEVIKRLPYGTPVDIWSAGVICYTLLCGYPPFHHDYVTEIDRLFRIICTGFYLFDSPYWDSISDDAKDVVKKMLVLDPNDRATAAELLAHPWFAQLPDSPKKKPGVNLLHVMSHLQRFNRKLKERVANTRRNSKSNISSSSSIHMCNSPTSSSGVKLMVNEKLANFRPSEDSEMLEVDLKDSVFLPEKSSSPWIKCKRGSSRNQKAAAPDLSI